MSLAIRLSAALAFAAFTGMCRAEAQQSPEAEMLREMREQIEMLSDRVNRPPEREHVRELQERIEMLERELRERNAPPPGAFPRPGPRSPREAFRAPDRLPGTVTLEFNGGGVTASVSTATPMYQIQGHSLNQSHQQGEITEREELTLVAAGMVKIDSRTGSIFVACEGTFTFSFVSLDENETGESEEANIKFNASVHLQPGEVKALVSQGGHTLTVKASLQPLAPPRNAPPNRRR